MAWQKIRLNITEKQLMYVHEYKNNVVCNFCHIGSVLLEIKNARAQQRTRSVLGNRLRSALIKIIPTVDIRVSAVIILSFR